MLILPAIDIFDGKVVRLYKGNYNEMTVFNENPVLVAKDFKSEGAEFIHIVDLEGAKDGTTPNLDVVENIVKETSLKVEIGGGIRSMEIIEKYLSIGVKRVILGTAAVTDNDFLCSAVKKHKEAVAVGVDIKDGYVAIKGWTEKSNLSCDEFFSHLCDIGVSTVICTDISKDGAMQGTNIKLYRDLSQKYNINIVASGGVSSLDDIKELRKMELYGAILGKAYYVGAIKLKEAIEVAK